MAESSLSMDPSLPLQEDSLMMPPPVPNRSVSSDLLQKIQIWKFRFGSTPTDRKEVPHLLLQTQWLMSQRIFSHHRWGQHLTTFELKCRFVSHTKIFLAEDKTVKHSSRQNRTSGEIGIYQYFITWFELCFHCPFLFLKLQLCIITNHYRDSPFLYLIPVRTVMLSLRWTGVATPWTVTERPSKHSSQCGSAKSRSLPWRRRTSTSS